MHRWLDTMRLPLGLAAANYLLWPAVSVILPAGLTTVGFNVARVVLMVWAGSVVTRRGVSGLRGAAIAGVAIMVVDHIILKGGMFLVEHALGKSTGNLSYLMAFAGVLASFVMFSPIAALLGLCGGLYGRRPRVSHVV